VAENVFVFNDHWTDASCVPEVNIRASGVSVQFLIHKFTIMNKITHPQIPVLRTWITTSPGSRVSPF
jgi:hypothetical protein